MIKLTALLPRKVGTTHDEFLDHWLNRHAPLIASLSSASLILRYEQHRTAWPAAESGWPEPKFDGVTTQWFESVDAFLAFATGADRVTIAADEANFLDTDRIEWVLTEHPPHVAMDGDISAD